MAMWKNNQLIELKKIINNQIIKCIASDIDKYKRYIAICFVNKLNINQTMVKKGWAIAYRYYSKDYIKDEDYARLNNAGIWKSKFEEPYIFRKKKINIINHADYYLSIIELLNFVLQ